MNARFPHSPRFARPPRPSVARLLASGLAMVAGTLGLVLAGCSRSAARSERPDSSAPTPAASYHPARGVSLTPFARDFVGLKTVDFTADRVPASAVLRTVQGSFVYVENGGWFLRTPVTLEALAADGSTWTVREGLYEGDRVVTDAVRSLWLAELHFLRAGQACAHEG